MNNYLHALNQHFSVNGASNQLSMNGERLSYMADAVIFLTVDSEGGYRRTIAVVKQSASVHHLGAKEYRIDNSGISIE